MMQFLNLDFDPWIINEADLIEKIHINNISKYTSWHADWEEAMKDGLRYMRGMNFGLSELWKEKKFKK